jgi:hypothetical protein
MLSFCPLQATMLAEDAELAERESYLPLLHGAFSAPEVFLLQYLPRDAPEAWRMSEVCIADPDQHQLVLRELHLCYHGMQERKHSTRPR